MSEVQQPVASVVEPTVAKTAETPAIEPLAPVTNTAAVTESAVPTTETAVEGTSTTADPVAATAETTAIEPLAPVTDAAAAATSPAAEKVVEPITEGQLAYKGPGLVKSLIPSKKEFWLSDAAIPRSNLDLYLRGEKAEISHPVVAWASQTGKGLLFFNKKGDTNHEHPSSILALYDATDLKKESSHEIAFKLHGHQHTLKAANDVERDGWYLSIEKSIELGKAQKETVHESESYKTELESVAKPAAAVAAASAAGAAAESRSRESNLEEKDAKKTQKSRSTSRGLFDRLKNKKEEAEVKHEEKKEEKAEAKAEKEAEKEAEKSAEATPVVIAGGATLDAPTTADRAVGAPVEATSEALPETVAAGETAPVDEKPKINKRGSIFGKLGSGWSVKSPSKEKSEKDAELKPEVPVKDAGVSETAPQLPEPNTATEPTADVVAAVIEPTEPTHESKPAEAAKEQLDAVSPTTQKSGFLSGLFPKRNRSVSPSAHVQEASKEETPVVATETPTITEPAAVEEPVAPVAAAETTPAEADRTVEEPAKTETTTANKRQSVLGSLGRRASKALNRMQAPKKENVAPTTEEAAKEETVTDATPAAETPVVNGEAKITEAAAPSTIGDVVPEAVDVGHPQPAATPVVATSA